MDRLSIAEPMQRVRITYRGDPQEAFNTDSLRSIINSREQAGPGREVPIAAVMDNRLMSLDSTIYEGAVIWPVLAKDQPGQQVYRRSLSLLLQAACRQVFPDVRLIVGQSLSGGYFYQWEGTRRQSEEAVRKIEDQMRAMVEQNLPIRQERCGVIRAIEQFKAAGMEDRILLLKTWWHETLRLVRLDEYFDLYHGPMALSTGCLQTFRLRAYEPGLILQFSDKDIRRGLNVTKPLFDVFLETYEWNKIIGVSNIGQLNDRCLTGGLDELIKIAEGLHEKKIASIADQAVAKKSARVILVAGPSSSGKTTTSKRLAIQLKVLGKHPLPLSIDNYYVDRELTPKDRNGEYNFEAIEAVDLELMCRNLQCLLGGQPVKLPRYNFEQGKRAPEGKWEEVRLPPAGVIILEGIHALNPSLIQFVPTAEVFKLYVSALGQLGLDDANRISTTDVRLLRRMVRDQLYRGYSAADTLAKWPSVKRGEARNIFPFQNEADVMFNSTLPYELSVLKVYAMNLLLAVPKDHPSFMEAYRLIKFLDVLVPVHPYRVPENSIIREFIGGSSFHY